MLQSMPDRAGGDVRAGGWVGCVQHTPSLIWSAVMPGPSRDCLPEVAQG
jgi:hypothetical protein